MTGQVIKTYPLLFTKIYSLSNHLLNVLFSQHTEHYNPIKLTVLVTVQLNAFQAHVWVIHKLSLQSSIRQHHGKNDEFLHFV